MATTVDLSASENLARMRAERGIDLFGEVWEGVTILSPGPGPAHQILLFRFHKAFDAAIDEPGLGCTFQTVNISDRPDDWTKNFRIPDLAVFLKGNPAIDRETRWLGGPDFAVEILSAGDRVHEKLGFYGKVGVRDLLIVDRNPWVLELYRLEDVFMKLVNRVTALDSNALTSEVLQLTFQLRPGTERPVIQVSQTLESAAWSI